MPKKPSSWAWVGQSPIKPDNGLSLFGASVDLNPHQIEAALERRLSQKTEIRRLFAIGWAVV